MKTSSLLCAAFVAAGLGLTACAENSVTAKQRWPWKTAVDIDITIDNRGCDYDVIASWDGCPQGRTIKTLISPSSACHFTWDPATAGLNAKTLNNFKVTLKRVSANERLFLAIWVTNTVGVATENVGGTFQAGDICYYSSLPKRGDSWDQRRLLFRRVRAYDDNGNQITYTNGYEDAILDLVTPYENGTKTLRQLDKTPLRTVRFSSDYWIMTMPIQAAAAWPTCMNLSEKHGTKSFKSNYGCNSMAYKLDDIRGTVAEGAEWPAKGFDVDSKSYIGQARSWMTKMGVFEKLGAEMILDLPTSAQWETAARAGTDGKQIFAPIATASGYGPLTASSTAQDITNTLGNAWVDADLLKGHVHAVTKGLCIWWFNRYARGHNADGKKAVNQNVGRLDPNAWGCYDMPGINKEWVLGYSCGTTELHSGLDPVCRSTSAAKYNAMGATQDENKEWGHNAIYYFPGVYFTMDNAKDAANFRLVLNTTNWLNK